MYKPIVKFILVLVYFLVIVNCSYGQENYLPGSLISIEGDTLKGFIDYRNWDYNPDEIFFKSGEDGEIITYKPKDILGFKVKDEVYVSASVEVELSSIRTNDLTYSPELIINVESVFLQTMFEGSKS
ncbi:hypothetical protein, partial [Xanthovirga aplysinae]|uniref:hypothetical protein n=1 Tax=Xanthovirga aplysinae TaxID=2529853 RepID=UPI001CA44FD5